MSFSCKYSVVVPVYNRPEELEELLESLARQTFKNFEVVIVEDGSSVRSDGVVQKHAKLLDIQYFFKTNTGPGPSRNFGFEKAKGEYLVVFDSDCILPERYFEEVENFMSHKRVDAWGGPDRGHEKFTDLQQAMAYTMSAFLTTGGIRGGKKRVGSFQPRSYNMGISRQIFEKTGGFKFDRYAEDIEFSIRIKQMGFVIALIPDAFVFHKRRATLKQFAHQVMNFGRGRALIGKKYPSEVKITHWFPVFFTLGFPLILISSLISIKFSSSLFVLYLFYFFMVALGALLYSRSIMVSVLSIPSAFIQMTFYGYGFLYEKFK